MRRFQDLTGARFSRLTVKSRASDGEYGQFRWNCECDCGGTAVVRGSGLRNGHTKSCGCLRNELATERCIARSGPKPLNPYRDRFYKSIRKEGDCWIWIGYVGADGYGRIGAHRKWRRAHIASYILHCGSIPDGLWVLHKCDVRACVNPDHLFLGTGLDNVADMVAKNRQAKGERFPQAKLKEHDVKEILASDERNKELAERFGVNQSVISNIRSRKQWRHVVT